MKDYVYLFVAFILWSTSSSIVVNFKGILPPFQSASIVILISFFFTSLFFLIKSPETVKILFKCRLSDILKVGSVGALGLFFYPVFYFYGLHSNSPIEANVINYFWPMIGVFAGFIFKVELFTQKKLVAILLGFIGVFITTISIKKLGGHDLIRSTKDIYPYVYAGLGALSYGFYTALIKKVSLKTTDNREVSIQSRFIVFLSFSALLHILYNTLINRDNFQFVDFTIAKFAYLVFYSIFNFSIAYLAWAYSVNRISISNASVLAYLIPILSTFVLSIWNSIPIEQNAIFGLSFILIGLYVQQDNKIYVTPLTGLSLSFVVFGVLVIIMPIPKDIDKGSLLSTLEVLIAIFAIYSGFTLSRVVNLYYSENTLFLLIEHKVANLFNLTKGLKPSLADKIDNYMNFLIEQNSMSRPFSIRDQQRFDIRHSELVSTIRESIPDDTTFNNQIDEIEQNVTNWRYSRGESLSLYEWIILIFLIIIPIIIIYQTRNEMPLSDIISIVFSTALVLCLLVIRDFDLRRPRMKIEFILLTQKLSKLLKRPPFVPLHYTNNLYFTEDLSVDEERSTIIRTFENDAYKDIKINYKSDTFRTLSIISIIITVILIVYSFMTKYSIININNIINGSY